MNRTLEESLSDLDAYERFFETRGLPVPVDAAESIREKRIRITADLERWRAIRSGVSISKEIS